MASSLISKYTFFFFILISITTIHAEQNSNQQLFAAIQTSNLAQVVQAINAGADINQPQETGYKYTPLMLALETLYTNTVTKHDIKRAVLFGSLIIGGITTSLMIDRLQPDIRKNDSPSTLQKIVDGSCVLGSFAGISFVSNALLNRIFTNSRQTHIYNAYLIVKVLLENPAIQLETVNPIIGQTAHQMIGNFIINNPAHQAHGHSYSCWHIGNSQDTFLKKLALFGMSIAIDIAVNMADDMLLQKSIDEIFIPLAQEIAKKAR